MSTETKNQDQIKEPTPGESTGGNKKVTFTDEQLPKVQELIDDAYQRAFAKANSKVTEKDTRIQTLEQELAEAKKSAKTAKPADKAEANEEVARLRSEIEEMKSVRANTEAEIKRRDELVAAERRKAEEARTETLRVKKETAIHNAAAKVGFYDTDDIYRLTQDFVKYDDDHGRWVVLNESGQPRMNNSYEPMSLSEFYQEYAMQKKHLVRSDVLFGAGSNESSRAGLSAEGSYKLTDLFGKGSNAKLANELAIKKPEEYKRMRQLAKTNGLI